MVSIPAIPLNADERITMLNRLSSGLLALALLCTALPALAQAASPAPSASATANASDAGDQAQGPGLDALSDQLDQIRQKVTVSANDDLLSTLRQGALQVQKQVDDLATQQTAELEHLDDR